MTKCVNTATADAHSRALPVRGKYGPSIVGRLEDGEGQFFCTLSGTSMRPLLEPSDLLEVSRYGSERVGVGDVVLCRSLERQDIVVHRVVSVDGQRIRTRGDASENPDSWELHPPEVLGRVRARWRRGRRRGVAGGRLGRWLVFLRRLSSRCGRPLQAALRGPYHALSTSGLVRTFVPRRLRSHVVLFRSNGRCFLRLMMGRKVIGSFDGERRRWMISPPFRLFVSPTVLAVPPATGTASFDAGRSARHGSCPEVAQACRSVSSISWVG
jgi:hypothetical protein